jgi:holliday junction DNA helicase RuvB
MSSDNKKPDIDLNGVEIEHNDINDVLSSEETEEDYVDYSFRPEKLEYFIGQDSVTENLKVYIEASKKRNEALEHVLFSGPPGLGKTTLAYIISKEMGTNIKSVQAPILEKPGDVAAYLTQLKKGDIFFIDEVHRLRQPVEEMLYSAMEDFKIDIQIGQGVSARTIKLDISPFTLIGATTRSGLLTKPFLDRFGIHANLSLYNEEALKIIATRTAGLMNIKMDEQSACEIAKRSRGTPRIVNRVLRRVRDFAQVIGSGDITLEITKISLDRLGIDSSGLDSMDRKILETIIDKYSGGPVGLDTLAVSIGETKDTISDVYEPFLIQRGFITRTTRGRTATVKAYDYLGRKGKNDNNQTNLFE